MMPVDKKTKIYIVLIIAATVLTTSLSFYFYQAFFSPNALLQEDQPYFLKIPNDAQFKNVSDSLYQNEIIQDIITFSFVAKILGYQDAVKPGLYQIEPRMNNFNIVRKLKSGAQTPVKLTFNNIRTTDELLEKITKNLQMTSDEFGALILNREFIEKYGFEPHNIIAMFIPNTYEVWWTTSPEQLFDKLHQEYVKFWNEDRLQKADGLQMTPLQVATLASIVQAETQKADERPKVAGVYLNRLKINMPLQADPTLVFAVGDFSIKRVLNIHKAIESPYNTYKNTGLPLGPINMPEISAIDAVLNFESHQYLYFCAKADFSGYHVFSKNFDEHLKNAQTYQRALNASKIF
jgi:UPF0755 protein